MKSLFVIMMAFLMLSCGSDDETSEAPERDLFFFLEKTNPQFSGDLNGQFTLWQTFPLGDFSSNGSATFPTGDTESPIKEIKYFITDEDKKIVITAPIYDTSSPDAVESVFGLGVKSLGLGDSDYKIQIESGDDIYRLCEDDGSAYQIEIIKTEEDNFDGINVWFVIDDIDFISCDSSEEGSLNNGLFLAKFFSYKPEN